MTETFLNGRITVSSLAAPTAADLEKLRALSEEDRKALIAEAIERGAKSPPSGKTADQIFESARAKAIKRANAV
ncbi:hypothetical protein [Rhodobium gokarnense]|uniref:Uncharacterized protein n=1 Tax=Rhodobium gokarnense TaxID=364296 RepID=A0ABT3H5U9_9HYPH|nr:hypothetical protein [Rhodobium gokarnense]MCW2305769.1 hypothetical protein [Rhodobium gokarnense]